MSKSCNDSSTLRQHAVYLNPVLPSHNIPVTAPGKIPCLLRHPSLSSSAPNEHNLTRNPSITGKKSTFTIRDLVRPKKPIMPSKIRYLDRTLVCSTRQSTPSSPFGQTRSQCSPQISASVPRLQSLTIIDKYDDCQPRWLLSLPTLVPPTTHSSPPFPTYFLSYLESQQRSSYFTRVTGCSYEVILGGHVFLRTHFFPSLVTFATCPIKTLGQRMRNRSLFSKCHIRS
jgi:hypothetical protein